MPGARGQTWRRTVFSFLSGSALPERQTNTLEGKETLLSIWMIRRQYAKRNGLAEEKEKSGLSALQCDNYRFFRVAVFFPHLLENKENRQTGALIT
jgi:hypothetical protein